MRNVVVDESANRRDICWCALGDESREGEFAIHHFQNLIRQQPACRSRRNVLRNTMRDARTLERATPKPYSCMTPCPHEIDRLCVPLEASRIEAIVSETE